MPEDFADRLVRHLKKGKTNFPCGRACKALMRLFKLYPVSVIHQALMSTRLEYGNVTYQETRKRCEQIIWAKENNREPHIGKRPKGRGRLFVSDSRQYPKQLPMRG